ncbi:pyridoxamine 5'-phosphate oxidase [Nocardioides gilvus]|uniref:pyridoxamine 5'-phosphate oxidase n=1 Tax=Nocardioides gilvus TaxID=1735589 RepID=UPI000D748471|nr:pyridoxamine 5'-phosphate oxidase [Nocardioides gilvus]
MPPEHDHLARLRHEYADRGLDEAEAAADPLAQFGLWLAEALDSGMHEPNAMVLSTVSTTGQPSSRMVLLKGFDERGFVFFTNHASRKGVDLAANPACALLFGWHPVERQVRVEAIASALSADEVAAYFRLRPRGAQIGAWASRQSQPVSSREELERTYAAYEEQFAGREVPVPPTWGGYRLRPEVVEFWQGRAGRMHDRLEWTRVDDGWQVVRRQP